MTERTFRDVDYIETNDEETVAIFTLSQLLQQKYAHRTGTQKEIENLKYEASSRFAELGFVVQVETVEWTLGTGPISIAITGRIEGGSKFDREKKGWEVNQANQRGQHILGEDKTGI